MFFFFSDSFENGITREKVLAKCSGNASNAWTNMWNKMMEERAGVERQNSKKGFEKMGVPAAWREFSWFRILRPFVFKGGRPDLENSKLV